MKMREKTLLVLLAAVAACEKTEPNPSVEEWAATPFTIGLEEHRQQKTFLWTEVDGNLSNGEESGNTLYVTDYNEVTLRASAPVNASSDHPGIVSLERMGNSSFRLQRKGEGIATIHLWNGNEEGLCFRRQFTVMGQSFVDVEGIRFEYAGEPLLITHFMGRRPLLLITPEDADNEDNSARKLSQGDFFLRPYLKADIWSDEKKTFVTNPGQGALLEFVGLEPENTSFRTITAFESEWDAPWKQMSRRLAAWGIIEEGEYPHWPCLSSCREDVSCFTEERPAQIWVACAYDSPYYMASIRIPVADGKVRYYYLYHAPER